MQSADPSEVGPSADGASVSEADSSAGAAQSEGEGGAPDSNETSEGPPRPAAPLARLRGVSLGRRGRPPLLNDVTWTLGPGVTGLVGAAGAGKTALCELLLGIVPQGRGEVEVLERRLPREGALVRSEVGYLPQDLAVVPGLTAIELVHFTGEVYARWRRKWVFEALARYQVPTRVPVERLAPLPRALLAMVLALGHQPKLVIADLPTCLDGGARARLLDALLSERGPSDLLIATDRPHELEGRCTALALLAQGQLVAGAAASIADALWRLDLAGDARPALPPPLVCLDAGPGAHGACWIVAGPPESVAALPREGVANLRAANFEEAVLARLRSLSATKPSSPS